MGPTQYQAHDWYDLMISDGTSRLKCFVLPTPENVASIEKGMVQSSSCIHVLLARWIRRVDTTTTSTQAMVFVIEKFHILSYESGSMTGSIYLTQENSHDFELVEMKICTAKRLELIQHSCLYNHHSSSSINFPLFGKRHYYLGLVNEMPITNNVWLTMANMSPDKLRMTAKAKPSLFRWNTTPDVLSRSNSLWSKDPRTNTRKIFKLAEALSFTDLSLLDRTSSSPGSCTTRTRIPLLGIITSKSNINHFARSDRNHHYPFQFQIGLGRYNVKSYT